MIMKLHYDDDGEPVSGVTTISTGQGTEDAPPWEEAERRLLELPDGGSISFDVGCGAFLIVLHIAEYGYLVTGYERGERDSFTLIERTLGDDPVTAFDGGDTRVFVRYAFVSQPLLLKALKTYYLTGKRDRECEWVPESEAVYD
jgi:hypothetical protein